MNYRSIPIRLEEHTNFFPPSTNFCERVICWSLRRYWVICKSPRLNKTYFRHLLTFPCRFHLSAFTSIHLIATGVSCFLGAGLLSFLIYVYCQRFHKPSQESAVIHPTTPNHLNYKGNTTPKNEKYTPMEFKVGADVWSPNLSPNAKHVASGSI